jgi:hypothetical protein
MRSPGAVYTLVRTSSIGATRPSKEMQSGNVAIRIALVKQYPYQRQHLHQRTPESSRQEHQARGIDGKSPKEMLDRTLFEDCGLYVWSLPQLHAIVVVTIEAVL